MKTILVGFDAFDPGFFERLHNEGKVPYLSKYLVSSKYSSFKVANPPQSEVSWTSISTGLNPGGHGLFDFVHRNPDTYGLFVSILPTKSSLLGNQFSPPHKAETIFDSAVKDGYQATSLWWPATFPSRLQSPVRTVPGLGTPDIFGQLGVGISYSMEPLTDENNLKTRTARLQRKNSTEYNGILAGPLQKSRTGSKQSYLDFKVIINDAHSAKLSLGNQILDLVVGQWSPVVEIRFQVGFMVSVKIVTRVILTQLQPDPVLYFLPLQLHPLASPWPYGTPKSMLNKIWKKQGAFLTLGWPQDTTALEEGFINNEHFLCLCDQIFKQRASIFMAMLDSYQEGILACVFDSLDRVQHMFWKNRPDIIESWYLKLDDFAGKINTKLSAKRDGDSINLIFLSDHGFQNFNYKVNVNRWLLEQGYLELVNGALSQDLSGVNWNKSHVYAVGLNSLYLNLEGREGQGVVPLAQKSEILEILRSKLLRWTGPDGKKVFQRVQTNQEAFNGPLSVHGPDLVLGYAPGYRASAETGLGGWGDKKIEWNTDHWSADHCIDANAVPGVIFNNRGLDNFPNPSYSDIPVMTIGKELPAQLAASPILGDDDQELLKERLKGLGYL